MPIEQAPGAAALGYAGAARVRPLPARRRRLSWSLNGARKAVLWLLVASGSLVIIEPAPYEALFAVAVIAFAPVLKFDRLFAPLVLGLALFDAGGLLALIPWTDQRESVTFTITSIYMSVNAVFFACLIYEDSAERLDVIRRAYTVAAVIGSIAAILGYFDIGGLADALTRYNRATGTFKDPNVLGPFLVPPLIWMGQRAMLGQIRRHRLATVATFLLICFALFLSFSRGAWGVFVASFGMMTLLTFLTTRSFRVRKRIVILACIGVAAGVVLFAFIMGFPSIHDVFLERASLNQDYDLGETGRFGNQWRSIPMLLMRPNGFGPLQFRNLFAGDDPHNVYVNAFASYGWLGGFAYCTLIVVTTIAGWWLVFRRTPWQPQAIMLWSCLFVQILQGFQIDTDHWRHLFLLLGCVWGLVAASHRHDARLRRARILRRPA